MNKPDWVQRTPFEVEQENERTGTLVNNSTYETTVGGPIVLDGLWFFYANRIQRETQQETFDQTGIAYEDKTDNARPQPDQVHWNARPGSHAGRQLHAEQHQPGLADLHLHDRPGRHHQPDSAQRPVGRYLSWRRDPESLHRVPGLEARVGKARCRRHVNRYRRLVVCHLLSGVCALQRAPLRRQRPRGPEQPPVHRQRYLLPADRTRHAQRQGRLRAFPVDAGGWQLAVGHRVLFRCRLRGECGRQPAARRRPVGAGVRAVRCRDARLARGTRCDHRHQHAVVLRQRQLGGQRPPDAEPRGPRRDRRQRGHGQHRRRRSRHHRAAPGCGVRPARRRPLHDSVVLQPLQRQLQREKFRP